MRGFPELFGECCFGPERTCPSKLTYECEVHRMMLYMPCRIPSTCSQTLRQRHLCDATSAGQLISHICHDGKLLRPSPPSE